MRPSIWVIDIHVWSRVFLFILLMWLYQIPEVHRRHNIILLLWDMTWSVFCYPERLRKMIMIKIIQVAAPKFAWVPCAPSFSLPERDCICTSSWSAASFLALLPWFWVAPSGIGIISPDASRHPTGRVTFEPLYNPKESFWRTWIVSQGNSDGNIKSETVHHLWFTSSVQPSAEIIRVMTMRVMWCNNSPRHMDPAPTLGCRNVAKGMSAERGMGTLLLFLCQVW